MKMFAVVMGALFAVSACGGGGSLPETCAKVLAKGKECASKTSKDLPAEVSKAFGEGIAAQEKAWTEAAKAGGDAAKALEVACKAAWDGGKTGAESMCPDVKWE